MKMGGEKERGREGEDGKERGEEELKKRLGRGLGLVPRLPTIQKACTSESGLERL